MPRPAPLSPAPLTEEEPGPTEFDERGFLSPPPTLKFLSVLTLPRPPHCHPPLPRTRLRRTEAGPCPHTVLALGR